jgi:hypothetical protein
MVFASPTFLFLFLPRVLAGYFGLPRRSGNAMLLLLASLCFYVWAKGRMQRSWYLDRVSLAGPNRQRSEGRG